MLYLSYCIYHVALVKMHLSCCICYFVFVMVPLVALHLSECICHIDFVMKLHFYVMFVMLHLSCSICHVALHDAFPAMNWLCYISMYHLLCYICYICHVVLVTANMSQCNCHGAFVKGILKVLSQSSAQPSTGCTGTLNSMK